MKIKIAAAAAVALLLQTQAFASEIIWRVLQMLQDIASNAISNLR